MNIKWKEFEINFIKENAKHLTDKQGSVMLSEIVGRKITTEAYRYKRKSLGLKKKPGRGKIELAQS